MCPCGTCNPVPLLLLELVVAGARIATFCLWHSADKGRAAPDSRFAGHRAVSVRAGPAMADGGVGPCAEHAGHAYAGRGECSQLSFSWVGT